MSTITAPPSLVPGEYRIVKDPEGRWKVIDPNGRDPFPDQEFDNSSVAFAEVIKCFEDIHLNFQHTGGIPDGVLSFNISDTVEITATVTLGMELFLESFARHLGITLDQAVQKAVRLLMIATDANRAGKIVAIIDDKEGTEEEITGILDTNDVE